MNKAITEEELSDLSSDNPKVKYKRAKSLKSTAEKNPERLYPHLDFFAKLLTSENNILKWTAIDIIGNLSRVDKKNRVNELFGELVGFLKAGKLVTASHAIGALAHIGVAKPTLQDKVFQELLNVERCTYETKECRTIALGKVIEALSQFHGRLNHNNEILDFVQRQTTNNRSATRKKAEKFLKSFAAHLRRKSAPD